MKKAQFLTKLGSSPIIVAHSTPTLMGTVEGVNTYELQILETDTNTQKTLRSRTILLYVNDEGGVDEKAYLQDQRLLNCPPRPVINYMKSNFAESKFDESFASDTSFKADVILNNGDGTFSKKTVIVFNDGGTISHGILT